MRFASINKEKLFELINFLIKEKRGRIIGVVKKNDDYVFEELENANNLYLAYDIPTLLPPGKKYLLPHKETLLKIIEESKEKDLARSVATEVTRAFPVQKIVQQPAQAPAQ